MTHFNKHHLSTIMAFFNAELPGEMPNALMDQLARFLKREGLLKNVDTNPETSDFIHEYGDDSDDSDDSDSESDEEFDSSSTDIEELPVKRNKKTKSYK